MSTFKPIDIDKISALSTVNVHKIPPRLGPVTCVIKECRCAWRGCTAPTYYRFNSVPYCIQHIIQSLVNQILELGAKPLPDITEVPNGGKFSYVYRVEMKRNDAPFGTIYTVERWLESRDATVDTCIRYIETHHWDFAEMTDERTKTKYKVTREVVSN